MQKNQGKSNRREIDMIFVVFVLGNIPLSRSQKQKKIKQRKLHTIGFIVFGL